MVGAKPRPSPGDFALSRRLAQLGRFRRSCLRPHYKFRPTPALDQITQRDVDVLHGEFLLDAEGYDGTRRLATQLPAQIVEDFAGRLAVDSKDSIAGP
jgi:hypothetical protein